MVGHGLGCKLTHRHDLGCGSVDANSDVNSEADTNGD